MDSKMSKYDKSIQECHQKFIKTKDSKKIVWNIKLCGSSHTYKTHYTLTDICKTLFISFSLSF